jgi:hypothetical protein
LVVKGLLFVLIVLIALVAGTLVLGATPEKPELTGPCTATGTIGSATYNASSLPDVIKVPREFTVQYTGTYGDAQPGQQRDYQGGGVSVEGPFGQAFRIASWGPGKTDKSSKAGPYHVSLDQRIPGGILVPVKGNHADIGRPCAGHGTIEIEGAGDFDMVAKWVLRSLTAVFFLLMLLAGMSRARP